MNQGTPVEERWVEQIGPALYRYTDSPRYSRSQPDKRTCSEMISATVRIREADEATRLVSFDAEGNRLGARFSILNRRLDGLSVLPLFLVDIGRSLG